MGCLSWLREIKMVFPFKDKELNKIAAFFNISTFLLTCAALVQPDWFRIKGINCTQSFSLSQFFTFEYDDGDSDGDDAIIQDNNDQYQYYIFKKTGVKGIPSCTTEEVVTLMRVLILLCFMVLLSSCIGVMINITSLNSRAIKMLRRNAVPSILCVFWVIAIVGVCYYTTVVFSSLNNGDSTTIQVDYEYGFYTITAAGAMSLLASAANLWGAPIASEADIQRQTLMEDWDGYDTHSVGPTPSVPALPPYTPSAEYLATIHPTYAPPALGVNQYFPFDNLNLNIVAPPPPYTP